MFEDEYEESLEQRVRNEQERQHQELLSKDVAELLELESFRRYVWHVLSLCRVMDKSMDINTHIMAFREGQRDIGIRIMQDVMGVKPAAYEQMRVEHTHQAEEDEARLNKLKEAEKNGR